MEQARDVVAVVVVVVAVVDFETIDAYFVAFSRDTHRSPTIGFAMMSVQWASDGDSDDRACSCCHCCNLSDYCNAKKRNYFDYIDHDDNCRCCRRRYYYCYTDYIHATVAVDDVAEMAAVVEPVNFLVVAN